MAIEPSSRERCRLESNIVRNNIKTVTVLPIALAEAAGKAVLKPAGGMHTGHNP